jgi:hypothetical protein
MNLNNFERRIYSQNGEDGITIEILIRLYDDMYNKYYVEFGTQDAKECNTRILREHFGWTGLLMDGFHENKDINLQKEFIMKENIVNLFQKYNVPKKFNLLSIDIDYNDFYVLYEILKNYTMDIVILEYNASFLPNEDAVIQYDPKGMWDGSNYYGASLLAYQNLMTKYGYSLVATDYKGVNAFYINNDILEEHLYKFINVNDIEKLYNSPKYNIGPRGGHPKDPKHRKYIKSTDLI